MTRTRKEIERYNEEAAAGGHATGIKVITKEFKPDDLIEAFSMWRCKHCRTEYRTPEDALICALQPADKLELKIGDFVTAGDYRFGWYDGDKDWVLENPNPTGWGHFALIYVVTAIGPTGERGRHELKYHLFTKGMTEDFTCGWTTTRGHYTPKKISPPPNLSLEGIQIPQKFNNLI
jgi:hypothetical protein